MGILGRWRNQQPEDNESTGIERLSDPNPYAEELYVADSSEEESLLLEESLGEIEESLILESALEPEESCDEEPEEEETSSRELEPHLAAESFAEEPEYEETSLAELESEYAEEMKAHLGAESYEDEVEMEEAKGEETSLEELEPHLATQSLEDESEYEETSLEELEPHLASQSLEDEPEYEETSLEELEAEYAEEMKAHLGAESYEDEIEVGEEPDEDEPEVEISEEEIAAVFAAQLATEDEQPYYATTELAEEPAAAAGTGPGVLASFNALRKSVKANIDRRVGSRTVTLSVEGESVRVLVFRGNQIVSWNTIPTQAPVVEQEAELDEEGNPLPVVEVPLATRLHNLFHEMGLGQNRVWNLLDKVGIRKSRLVMDLSLYSTLLRHLELPKVRQKYLQPVVESEVLENIPFVREEVDIAWRHQSNSEGETIFAIALPRDRVDSQVQLVKEAGGIPSAAYSKAIALARVAGYSDAVVVHLEPYQAAVVLVQESVPQVVHQLEFPEGEADPQQYTDALALVIDQIAEYNEVLDLQNGNVLVPVVLTGDTSENNPIAELLPETLARDVLFVQPGLDCPDQLPMSEYATNLGLFLVDRASTARTSKNDDKSRMPYLNLLPERHLPRTVPVLQTAVFVTLLLLAIHPFNFPSRVDAKAQEAEIVASQLKRLQSQNQQRIILLSNERSTQNLLGTVNEEITALESRLDDFQIELDLLLARMQALTKAARPPTVDVFTVAPQGAGFAVQGIANEYTQILGYAENIRATGLFTGAKIVRVDDGTEQGPSRAPSPLEIAVLGPNAGEDELMPTPGDGFVSFQIHASIPEEELDRGSGEGEED
ncbi:MAG: hypothetical protein ACE5Q6_08705 [Dehalococcoidia bacterium]